ncbi:hypothetical protein F4779DRAFT_623878 [Xylariaceae sp. FL0662B]|nr:hypothetical protein F4779DRAFT_623878 [Xylariaceae sp. FL0662B]
MFFQCFAKSVVLALAFYRATAIPTASDPGIELESGGMKVRDDPQPCNSSLGLVGDGIPIQHILHRQVTVTVECQSARTCSTGYLRQVNASFEWSVGTEGRPDANFTDGGFAVLPGFAEFGPYECGTQSDNSVCVWYGMAHTGYTVRYSVQGDCSGETINTDSYVIYAPNDNNVNGPGFYCVSGNACRKLNSEYWQYGVKDGPP